MNVGLFWILFLMCRPMAGKFWKRSALKRQEAIIKEAGLHISIGKTSFVNYYPDKIYLPPLRPAPPGFPTPFGIPDPDGLTIDGGRAPLAFVISGRPLFIRLAA